MNLFFTIFHPHAFDQIHLSLIVLHIVAALVALVAAPIAMITRKGGRQHRRWGKFYFWSMFATNTSALILLAWRFNLFLFGVTILSFYGAWSGYRVLERKRPSINGLSRWLDWGPTWVALAAGLALLGWGILTALGFTQLWIPGDGGIPLIFILLPLIFGAVISSDAVTDLRMYRTPSTEPRWWWYYHMERMLGSYLGLLTALMVQQAAPRLPLSLQWIAWGLPSLIGMPAIVFWIHRERQRFSQHQNAVHPSDSERFIKSS
jgi:uncharacterized membrane protein